MAQEEKDDTFIFKHNIKNDLYTDRMDEIMSELNEWHTNWKIKQGNIRIGDDYFNYHKMDTNTPTSSKKERVSIDIQNLAEKAEELDNNYKEEIEALNEKCTNLKSKIAKLKEIKSAKTEKKNLMNQDDIIDDESYEDVVNAISKANDEASHYTNEYQILFKEMKGLQSEFNEMKRIIERLRSCLRDEKIFLEDQREREIQARLDNNRVSNTYPSSIDNTVQGAGAHGSHSIKIHEVDYPKFDFTSGIEQKGLTKNDINKKLPISIDQWVTMKKHIVRQCSIYLGDTLYKQYEDISTIQSKLTKHYMSGFSDDSIDNIYHHYGEWLKIMCMDEEKLMLTYPKDEHDYSKKYYNSEYQKMRCIIDIKAVKQAIKKLDHYLYTGLQQMINNSVGNSKVNANQIDRSIVESIYNTSNTNIENTINELGFNVLEKLDGAYCCFMEIKNHRCKPVRHLLINDMKQIYNIPPIEDKYHQHGIDQIAKLFNHYNRSKYSLTHIHSSNMIEILAHMMENMKNGDTELDRLIKDAEEKNKKYIQTYQEEIKRTISELPSEKGANKILKDLKIDIEKALQRKMLSSDTKKGTPGDDKSKNKKNEDDKKDLKNQINKITKKGTKPYKPCIICKKLKKSSNMHWLSECTYNPLSSSFKDDDATWEAIKDISIKDKPLIKSTYVKKDGKYHIKED